MLIFLCVIATKKLHKKITLKRNGKFEHFKLNSTRTNAILNYIIITFHNKIKTLIYKYIHY